MSRGVLVRRHAEKKSRCICALNETLAPSQLTAGGDRGHERRVLAALFHLCHALVRRARLAHSLCCGEMPMRGATKRGDTPFEFATSASDETRLKL